MTRKPTDSTAPKHLAAATREWFEQVCDTFELEPHHVKLLTLAGEAWDRCCDARKAIAKHGTTYLDRWKQPHARPEVKIENDSRVAFARLLRELSLDIDAPAESPRLPSRAGTRN